MSPSDAIRGRTRRELAANLDLSGLTPRAVAEALGFSDRRLDQTLSAGPSADPVDLWRLRDLLDGTIRDHGEEPRGWTVLTDAARERFARWSSLRSPYRPV